MKCSLTLLTSALIATISACSTIPPIEDRPTTNQIGPISQPEWRAGYTKELVNIQNGESAGYEILNTDTDLGMRMASNRSDRKGCEWTGSSDWFSPATSWEGCGTGEWSSGTQTVELISGGLWPLETGAKAVYRGSPVSSQGTKGTIVKRKCEVSGPVALTISDTDYDAMKVVCKANRNEGHRDVRTWYWNAELGEIKYRRTHTKDGLLADFEIVSAAE